MSFKKGHIDWLVLLPVVGLMLFSLAFVYSASATISEQKFGGEAALFWNHSIRVLAALIIMILFAVLDYHYWQKLSKFLIITSVVALAIVLVAGSTSKGATRWLDLGIIRIQPSEFAKFALIIHFSSLLVDKREKIKDFKEGFLPFLVWLGAICLLIAMQPNFSTMAIIFLIGMAMLFIGNTNLFHLIGTFIAGGFAASIYAVSAEYRMKRFMAFFGSSDASVSKDVQYQLNQALIALGNGGFSGVGAGQSGQSQMFLPESYGDFIFSIIGEEFGFIGLIGIIIAFSLIFWRGFIIAKNAPDNFGYFLAIGIVITFAVYVFVNAGVNTGLLPTTGVPMPFLSYGGTAVMIYAAAIGTLLNISAQAGIYPREPKVEPYQTNFIDNLDTQDEEY